MKTKTRYFTHVDGFGDDTAFVAITSKQHYLMSGQGVKTICTHGSVEGHLRFCLEAVDRGVWKEITKQQAKALVKS